MDDFTYEDDDEDVHGGAAGNDQEDEEAPPDYDDEEYVGHDDEEADVNGGEDAGTSTLLTSVVRDPHVQELLLRKSSNAGREKAKLAQLEIDSNTLLYAGCGPEDTRLKVMLMAVQMKAKHKWTDASFDENLKFWHPTEKRWEKLCFEVFSQGLATPLPS